MPGHGEKLTRKREVAIAALLVEPTLDQAAIAAGVAPSTLRRWRRLPSFAEEYRARRLESLEHAVGVLHGLAAAAAAALARALESGDTGAEIRAACAIFDRAAAGSELLDLAARIEALEERFSPEA